MEVSSWIRVVLRHQMKVRPTDGLRHEEMTGGRWWVGRWDFFKDFVVDICWFFWEVQPSFFFDSGWGEKYTIQKKPLIFIWEWWLIFRVMFAWINDAYNLIILFLKI